MADLEGSPPVDEAERQQRREGWRQFLVGIQGAMQDPVKSSILMQLGAGLAQDRAPGQSRTDQISRAISGGAHAGAVAQQQQLETAGQREAAGQRQQQVDLQRQEVEQRGEIAQAEEAGRERRSRREEQVVGERLEFQERNADRRHQARMQAEQNSLQRQMAAIEAQMRRADLRHEERMAQQQSLVGLKKRELELQEAASPSGLDPKDAADLYEFAISKSVDEATGEINFAQADQIYQGFRRASGGQDILERPDVGQMAQAIRAESPKKDVNALIQQVAKTKWPADYKSAVIEALRGGEGEGGEAGSAEGTGTSDGGASSPAALLQEGRQLMESGDEEALVQFWRRHARELLRAGGGELLATVNPIRNKVREILEKRRLEGRAEAEEFVSQPRKVPGQVLP